MPTTTIEEKIKANLIVLSDESHEEYDENVKAIICPFFQKGNNKDCFGCTQDIETVSACKDLYVAVIADRPMEIYSPEFDAIKVREKKSLAELPSIGVMKCDQCYFSDSCPEYQLKSTCSIDWGSNIDATNPKAMFDKLIEMQHSRISIARAAELADGGIPDQNLSNEMDRMQTMLQSRNNMDADKFSLNIESTTNSKVGGGLLASLFGGAMKGNAPAEQPKQIEGDYSEIIELPTEPGPIQRKASDITFKEKDFAEKKSVIRIPTSKSKRK